MNKEVINGKPFICVTKLVPSHNLVCDRSPVEDNDAEEDEDLKRAIALSLEQNVTGSNEHTMDISDVRSLISTF